MNLQELSKLLNALSIGFKAMAGELSVQQATMDYNPIRPPEPNPPAPNKINNLTRKTSNLPNPPKESVSSEPSEPSIPASSDTEEELDADGMPWDERIHSRTKSKLSNGCWRLKRGVDKDLVEDIKQDPPKPPQPSVTIWTFADFMIAVQKHTPPIAPGDLADVFKELNIKEGITDLAKDQSLIPSVVEKLGLKK